MRKEPGLLIDAFPKEGSEFNGPVGWRWFSKKKISSLEFMRAAPFGSSITYLFTI